jgi:hypothetical protein
MRLTHLIAAGSAALALTFAAAPTQAAQVWDAVADFSSSSSTLVNGVWSYGWDSGSGFVAYDTNRTCFDGLSCWQSPGANMIYEVPMVAANLTDHTLQYGGSVTDPTVVHPVGVLNLHPGMTLDGSNTPIDSIVRFTAPTAGAYSFSGFFQTLDINPSGVSIFANGVMLTPLSIVDHATTSPLAAGGVSPFSGTVTLAQNGTIDFRVNRAGEIWNDSTGLSARVAAIPEPAAWLLMILGFGGVGATLRARRRNVAVTA